MTLLKIYWRLKAVFKKLCFKIMFGKRFSIGKNTTFRKNFGLYLEKGASIKIGNDCFFNRGCSINCLESVEIGDHTIFGENSKFMTKTINSEIEQSSFVSRVTRWAR